MKITLLTSRKRHSPLIGRTSWDFERWSAVVSVVSFRSLVFQTAVLFLGEILLPIAMVLIKVGEIPPALSHSGEGRLWEKGKPLCIG